MTTLERFLKYISIDTTSSSKSTTFPSTKTQFELIELLQQELEQLGIKSIIYDKENCYLYACLKGDDKLQKVGFISHLDTSENACGKVISPKIISNYNGENIELNKNVILDLKTYPDLKNHKGKTIITTDGTTLLGADDKAGIAEIMTMLEHFSKTRDRHGDIYVCFTPDEEIGKSTDKFNKENFPVNYAYTIDGSDLGELSYENFNAATAYVDIEGNCTHTGYAKGIMINSLLVANEFISSLPSCETPETTEEYEGFFHLETVEGDVNHTKLQYLIRDFDRENFARRKRRIEELSENLSKKYSTKITTEIKDSYQNMKNTIEKDMKVVDIVKTAMNNLNIKPLIKPIRGGTDGAALSSMGIACPNIGTGGHNFHGVTEYIALEDMEKTSEILIAIVKEVSSIK